MRFMTIAAAVFYYVLFTGNAHAYLDPGTGSILLQGLIGAIATGMFMCKMYWAKFKSILGLSPAGSDDVGSDEANKS